MVKCFFLSKMRFPNNAKFSLIRKINKNNFDTGRSVRQWAARPRPRVRLRTSLPDSDTASHDDRYYHSGTVSTWGRGDPQLGDPYSQFQLPPYSCAAGDVSSPFLFPCRRAWRTRAAPSSHQHALRFMRATSMQSCAVNVGIGNELRHAVMDRHPCCMNIVYFCSLCNPQVEKPVLQSLWITDWCVV